MRFFVLTVLALSVSSPASAQAAEPAPATLNVRDADLRDVFRMLARAHDLNLVVDNRVEQKVTVRLADIPALDAVRFLCGEYGLDLVEQPGVWRIVAPPAPEPPPLDVRMESAGLHVDVRAAPLDQLVAAVQEAAGVNLMVRPGASGTVTGRLSGMEVEAALDVLMRNAGFQLVRDGDVWVVDQAPPETTSASRGLRVEVTDGLVSLDVWQADVAEVLRQIGKQVDEEGLVVYGEPAGTVTARLERVPALDALRTVLRGTGLDVRREAGRLVVGQADAHGFGGSELMRLAHLRADVAMEMLPATATAGVTVALVKEHNGLLVTGPRQNVQRVQRALAAIDHPTPQILIEALVVDYQAADLFDLGLQFGRSAEAASADDASRGRYRFGDTGLSGEANGKRLNGFLGEPGALGRLFGIHTIGQLPDDFYVRLQALDRDGRLHVRSRPQVATVNGHTAQISIGTTQYYLLSTNAGLPYSPRPGETPFLTESQRFERIDASDKLEITPWVSANGEVTVQIRPEFSAPVGEFDPDVPPTINTRVLESTVRLRDGETILLGGLVRESEEVTQTNVPFLGSLPLLGRLFRSERRDRRTSELVIFLTPHVFYGDPSDDAKWRALRDTLDLNADDAGWRFGYTEGG